MSGVKGPFGGIGVVLAGDMRQLPPVNGNTTGKSASIYQVRPPRPSKPMFGCTTHN